MFTWGPPSPSGRSCHVGINTRGNYTPRSSFNPQLYTESLCHDMPLKMFNIIVPLGHNSWLTFEVFLLLRRVCWAPMPESLGLGWEWGVMMALLKGTFFRPLLEISYFSKRYLETEEGKLYTPPFPLWTTDTKNGSMVSRKNASLASMVSQSRRVLMSKLKRRRFCSTSELAVYRELLLDFIAIWDSYRVLTTG